MKVKEVLKVLEEIVPFSLSACWDNSGLQVGESTQEVKKVLLALEINRDVIQESEEIGANLIITHHPLLFSPVKRVEGDKYPGNVLFALIKNGVSLISLHTNWDAVKGGVADSLAQMLCLEEILPLDESEGIPLGRIGYLPTPSSAIALGYYLAERLGASHFRVVGEAEKEVRRVALCPGSGGELWHTALEKGVELYITGDIKYHQAREAIEDELVLLDLGHFATENFSIKILAERLREHVPTLEIAVDRVLKDPFRIFPRGG